jgi:hypothetical protein
MVVADWLNMDDVNNLTESPRSNNISDGAIIRRIPQHYKNANVIEITSGVANTNRGPFQILFLPS